MLGLGLGLQNGKLRKTIINLGYPYTNFEDGISTWQA